MFADDTSALCSGNTIAVARERAQLAATSLVSWGLKEQQLRAVANGYVRGALEHAAAAWLPATSKTNVELLDREMRAAAREVTGCIRSAPHHGVMAEAMTEAMKPRRHG
ncbi:hypothetical protein FJT64_024299 [Amphibalanus amphitrite]|uniref:Uncharacterized protein n=1 Tax=Amphibalanus amphitrite TaxID=1232801 RepID=A0A6A4WP69_AMPAM|nr:hypothetical protein FJT64_024299 [Amphibalanus amphitrite]